MQKDSIFYYKMTKVGFRINNNNDILFKKSRIDNRKFCCIALSKNKIVAIGINKFKTNPHYPEYANSKKLCTHAEIDMLIKISKKSFQYNITDVVIVRGCKTLYNSFPCKLCYAHLKDELNGVSLHYYKNGIWYNEIL